MLGESLRTRRPEAGERKTYLRYLSNTLAYVFTFGLLRSMACYQLLHFGHINRSTKYLLAVGSLSPIFFNMWVRLMDIPNSDEPYSLLD